MDFWVLMKTPNGNREFLIEVKPSKESKFFKVALKEGKEPGVPRPKPKSDNPKVMQRWPKGFFREALIKNVNFLLTQRHSGSDQIGVLAFIDLCMCLKVFEWIVFDRPGNPGAFFAVLKQTGQCWDDSIGGFVIAALHLAIFNVFFIGEAVVYNH